MVIPIHHGMLKHLDIDDYKFHLYIYIDSICVICFYQSNKMYIYIYTYNQTYMCLYMGALYGFFIRVWKLFMCYLNIAVSFSNSPM